VNAPSARQLPALVWTGTEMIAWGGAGATFDTSTGGRYNPSTDQWTATSLVNAPSPRDWSASVWTGSKMLIWGGQTYDGTYAYHNLLPKPLFDQYLAAGCKDDDSSQKCGDLMAQMDNITADLNPYALDFPVCLLPEQRTFLRTIASARRARVVGASPYWPPDYEPCADSWTATYLNRADVQSAIHVNGAVVWADCSDAVGNLYNLTDVLAPMMPVYKQLIDSGSKLKILVYSGDDDAVCSSLGTQQWIWNLGYPVTRAWTDWKVDGQVAGFLVQFQGFSFTTIHGAGHMVPQTRPAQSLAMFQHFLSGQ